MRILLLPHTYNTPSTRLPAFHHSHITATMCYHCHGLGYNPSATQHRSENCPDPTNKYSRVLDSLSKQRWCTHCGVVYSVNWVEDPRRPGDTPIPYCKACNSPMDGDGTAARYPRRVDLNYRSRPVNRSCGCGSCNRSRGDGSSGDGSSHRPSGSRAGYGPTYPTPMVPTHVDACGRRLTGILRAAATVPSSHVSAPPVVLPSTRPPTVRVVTANPFGGGAFGGAFGGPSGGPLMVGPFGVASLGAPLDGLCTPGWAVGTQSGPFIGPNSSRSRDMYCSSCRKVTTVPTGAVEPTCVYCSNRL